MSPKFSIIVPLAKPNEWIEECVTHCLAQNEKSFEIIILPDFKFNLPNQLTNKRISIIPTGKIGPAEKRDIGIKKAKGVYCAFIDDDAYPTSNWLNEIEKEFLVNSKIGAVGGPAVTPESDPLMARLSGTFYESKLGSGSYTYRYVPEKKQFVEDFPSVNLTMRTDLLKKIGGFDCAYYPGEDTKLCLEIINLGFKISYTPKAIIYHHRRPSIIKHFKQLANYAMHRGYFVKKFPKTSLKPIYFIPTLFLIFNLKGLILVPLLFPQFFIFYLAILAVYFVLAFISIKNTLFLRFLGTIFMWISHNVYGLYFVFGLLKKDLKK